MGIRSKSLRISTFTGFLFTSWFTVLETVFASWYNVYDKL